MSEGLRELEQLRRIESVTDAALSRLDVQDLLPELLDRILDLLRADTAAIMLVDAHARQLVATAARGLEEEVRQGLRVAIGHGFAGRIARTREPVVIDEITPDDVVGPVLLREGIRSVLGVPMFLRDEVIGVLHIGTRTPRRFTADDVRLLQVVADRAAVVGRIRDHQTERTAAVALQRSLLPARLPGVPGLELAARYVPGHEFGVGGDWYDVFTLPTGWVGAVIGDVSGHGLVSAVVMGRIRSALRSYALICDDPAAALTLLDRKVNHFEAGTFTTVLYAMISPARDTVLVSSAAHLPPVHARAGGPVELCALPIDPPLGVGRLTAARRCTSVPLAVGDCLIGYTDGLIERRDQIIDTGFEKLTSGIAPDHPESICTALTTLFDVEQPVDDVAVLALRRVHA